MRWPRCVSVLPQIRPVPPSIDAPVGGVWELLAGRQNHDVEAVRELWAFFADKALPP